MAYGRSALLGLLPWLVATAPMACQSQAERVDQTAWRLADAEWRNGAPTAFATWQALDPAQPYGRAAHARLRIADLGYRRAVELLRRGEPGLRDTLGEALGLAPMDPALYLPFARACRERGALVRAADFYRKFIARNPGSLDAEAARAALAALSGGPEVPDPGGGDGLGAPPSSPGWLPVAFALGGAILLLLALVLLIARPRGRHSLRELLVERPEIHYEVAYQIGCLRHEFLKHRIGAAGEALAARADGRASAEQQRFLEERLCRGEPLLSAWRAHLRGIERILGVRRSLARMDPAFRAAERALVLLARVASSTQPRAGAKVATARATLQRFDRELGELLAGLACCPLDEAFLRDVVAATRAEWASGKVDLDGIVIGPVPDGIAVDVYRTDLRIVLKNIVRNAIAALAESPPPRRLAVDVAVELEATGEEVVRIRIRDSATSPLPAMAGSTGVGHGLGIVQIALQRYDGSLAVVPAGDGYAKAVVVRLFRSQATPGVGAAA